MFGGKFACDCCGEEGLKKKEVKQVCEECFKRNFTNEKMLLEQVRRKLTDEERLIIETLKKSEPRQPDISNYRILK